MPLCFCLAEKKCAEKKIEKLASRLWKLCESWWVSFHLTKCKTFVSGYNISIKTESGKVTNVAKKKKKKKVFM